MDHGQPVESLDQSQVAALLVAGRTRGMERIPWTDPGRLQELVIQLGARGDPLRGLMPAPAWAWSSEPSEPKQSLPEEMDRLQVYCLRREAREEVCDGSYEPVHCLERYADCSSSEMEPLEAHLDCLETVPCGEELECGAFLQRTHWPCGWN